MKTESDNLAGCPFCGKAGFLEEVKTVGWRGGKARTLVRYRAQCPDQSCLGHHNRLCVDKETAIKKWNTRNKSVKKVLKDMTNRSAGMHMIQPETKGHGHSDEYFGAAYIPEFTTAEDIAHLKSFKTENEINTAVKGILNKYWE